MEITTLHWHCGCYWRKQLFHRENTIFLVLDVADLPLKIENTVAWARPLVTYPVMPRAKRVSRGVKKATLNSPPACAPPAHPAQEEAALTPCRHKAFR
jgi:hypothetical protein